MEKSSTYAYVLLTCLVGIAFWIALAASVDMDYAVTAFTFGDASAKAASMSISSVVHDSFAQEFLWFPVSVVLAVTTLFLPRASWRIWVVVAAVLVSVPAGSLFSPILGIGFPLYLIRASDGETWGEAWPAMSAVGFWVILSIGYIAVQWLVCKKTRRNAPTKHSTLSAGAAEA